MADMEAALSQATSRLRAAFDSGRTRGYGWRLGQLRALRRLLTDGMPALLAALQKDLHKSAVEGYGSECSLVEHEIQLALDHLSEWMRPERKGTDPLNLPGHSSVLRQPYGVVLVVGPSNYPVMLSLMPLVGCIAAGNCACLKLPTPEAVPASSATLARLVREYLDPECFAVLEGDREAMAAALAVRWDLIFFTGSPALGRVVAQAAAQHLTPVLLELGGQNPCVVDRTASLPLAARRIVWGALLNCGQSCLRPDYVLVHADVVTEFRTLVRRYISEFYGERPEASEFFGRLPNAPGFARVAAIVEQDRAFLEVGGQVDEAARFVAPTVLLFPGLPQYAKSAAAQQEIFGPILPIVQYETLEEVLAFINRREKPLAMYAFTGDRSVSEALLTQTSSGSVCINDVMLQFINLKLPFGGVGSSGIGAYHGRHSFEAFSHRRAVLAKPNVSLFDIPLRYPPHSPFAAAVLRILQRPLPSPPRWLRLSVKVAVLAILLGALLRSPTASDKARRVLQILLE